VVAGVVVMGEEVAVAAAVAAAVVAAEQPHASARQRRT
jgi:hypothetical protein